MVIKLDVIQTVGLAVLVYLLGSFIKGKVKFFQKYFIPAPVIGGLICSILIFIGVRTNAFTVEMNSVLQDFFMNLFFTGTGFTCSYAILKKSGKLGLILAIGAVAFLVVQNLVGVGLASAFGLNKLLGVAMGSISMSGGVGTASAFGRIFEGMGVTLEIMRGLENPDYQAYFMNWARVWCRKAKEEYIQLLLTNDVHSPGELRANMTPRNFPEWYDAFGIKPGDPLFVPEEKRVKIW